MGPTQRRKGWWVGWCLGELGLFQVLSLPCSFHVEGKEGGRKPFQGTRPQMRATLLRGAVGTQNRWEPAPPGATLDMACVQEDAQRLLEILLSQRSPCSLP